MLPSVSQTDWPQVDLCSNSSLYRYRHDSLRQAWQQESPRLFAESNSDIFVEAIALNQDGR